jgi:hypothetical protein
MSRQKLGAQIQIRDARLTATTVQGEENIYCAKKRK